MKKCLVFAIVFSVTVTLGIGAAFAGQGNNSPSGPHYNLNIIGVPKNKTADMNGNNGHRIFVPLYGKCKINLAKGDFQVLDANGTDGVAAFQLPAPDENKDGVTEYSVFARALGTPGGSSITTTCVVDTDSDYDGNTVNGAETYCSIYQMILIRSTGKSSFTNVSRELLYVYIDIDLDGDADIRVPLFDDSVDEYYWDYDNNGLKLAQLRFYDVETTVEDIIPE